MDTRTPLQRRRIMQSVKSKNTAPELAVRRVFHSLGHRFGLHNKKIIGKPDLVLRKYKALVFVNGCFWHGHSCPKGRLPKSRLDFWGPKIERNKLRDIANIRSLKKEGWAVLTLWECQTTKPEVLKRHIQTFSLRIKRRLG